MYLNWAEPIDKLKPHIERVRELADKPGRSVRFGLRVDLFARETEELAWEKAAQILETTQKQQVQIAHSRGAGPQQSEGARRLLADAAKGDVVDERLWTAIARETGGRSNSTSLVGTPEQVADALLKYYDLGITTFLIRGFDPLVDTIEYGRELIPLIRRKVAERDALNAASTERKAA